MKTDTMENQLMFFVLYAFVGIAGIIGNALTFLIFWRERKSSVFHMQLAVANTITLSSTFFSAPSVLRGEWLFGDTLCQLFGFQVFFAGFGELALVSIICIETYMGVCGTQKQEHPSKSVEFLISLMVWGYALLFSLAPLLGWNAYKPDSLATSCGIDIQDYTTSNYSYLLVTHIVFLMMAVPAMVCLILTLCRKHGDSRAFQSFFSEKELVRVTFSLFMILGLGCFPYYLRVIYFLRGFPPIFDSFLGVEFSHLTMKACCLLQPAAYMFVSEKFRHSVISVLTGSDPVKKGA